MLQVQSLTPMDYSGLPPTLREGSRLYIEHGVIPGGFLQAVISNDLKESFARADHINQFRMFEIVKWFYQECPATAWGSPEKMQAWNEIGGLREGT